MYQLWAGCAGKRWVRCGSVVVRLWVGRGPASPLLGGQR